MNTSLDTNPGAAKLLMEREKQGLLFAISLNLGMGILFAALVFFVSQSLFELVVTLSADLLISAAMVVFFFKVRANQWFTFSGVTITVLYLLLIMVLPWVWYYSVGGEAVARSYFLKTETFTLLFVLLVLSCLPVRPAYPLILSVGTSIYSVAMFFVAVSDPRTVLTPSILESVTGEAANPGLYFGNIFYTISSGVILAIFLNRFRQTVAHAANFEHATHQLGKYFSPGIVQMIATSGQDFLKPGGKLQNVAVLFSDIRGFTTISESLPAERVVELLSLYQEQMSAAIFEHGGTLDKFIGDGIMATFGTPIPGENDVANAVAAGLSMQKRLAALDEVLAARGLPKIAHGIGIDYGEVIAGNVGTSARLEYTVIGDAANSAERIQAACKTTGETFLVSANVAKRVAGQFTFTEKGEILLRGKTTPTKIFAVTGKTS